MQTQSDRWRSSLIRVFPRGFTQLYWSSFMEIFICLQRLTLNLPIFFCPEKAVRLLCLLHIQEHVRLDFIMVAKHLLTMNPDQSDLGPYCLIYAKHKQMSFFCLFDLILYTPVNIYLLCRYGSSWVEPVLHVSKDKCVLLKDTTQWCPWGSNLKPLGLE